MVEAEEQRLDGRRRLASQLGWASGSLFVVVMAAGADRPPPPGFILVIAYGVLLGVLVGHALPPVLALWDVRGAGPATRRVALWGFLAGLALVALTTVLSTGEPSIDVDPAARLVGFLVAGATGALAATALAATGRILDHRRRS